MNTQKHFEVYTIISEKKSFPQIEAQEFLSWARADLRGSDNRARGNAISNIKKALHAKIDDIIANTHVRYANDWNSRCNTETKLKILKKLGIKYNSIIKPITDIRDIYEHQYRVPDIEQVRFYYEIAELWLKEISDKYSFTSVAIANLPFKTGEISYVNGNYQIRNFKFYEKRDVVVFDNQRESIYIIKIDGNQEQILYKDLSWKELIEKEKQAIKKAYRNNTPISQDAITRIVLEYILWLNS